MTQLLTPKNTLNFSIDIEALSVKIDSVILSIGAYCIETGDCFYQEVNPYQPGRGIDPATLGWWLDQKIPVPYNLKAEMLGDCLESLNKFLKLEGAQEIRVWAKSPSFDLAILKDAMEQTRTEPAWSFRAERDYRTLSKLFPQIRREETVGVAHHALDDAINQGKHIAQIFSYLAEITARPV